LREELEDTERRLEDALARLAQMEEEKQHWLFMEEVGCNSTIVGNPGTRCGTAPAPNLRFYYMDLS
jgi:hypothetical protein